MRKKILKFILAVIFLMTISNVALAGNSVSLQVSCTMPEIPGINAPLIEEQSVRTDTATTAVTTTTQEASNVQQENTNFLNEVQRRIPAIMQEDKEYQKPLQEGKILPVIVETLYCR